MSTAAPSALQDTVAELTVAARAALSNQTTEEFEGLEQFLAQVEGYVRELQQSMWSREIKTAISHVEGGSPLTAADQEVIRAFLISDAEHYVALENNFPDWCKELERLLADVTKRVNMVDRGNIAELRAVLKDAQRLLPDIRNYLDEKQRIQRFELALSNLDAPSRKMMGKILREAIDNPKR